MATNCIQIPQMAKDSLEDQLHTAILNGDNQTVSNILHQGANINFVCLSGKTLLGIAAEKGNVKTLQLLLDNNEEKVLPNKYNSEMYSTKSLDVQPKYFQFSGGNRDHKGTQGSCPEVKSPSEIESHCEWCTGTSECLCAFKTSSSKQNLGYFVVIHQDIEAGVRQSCIDTSSNTIDENWNSHGGTFANCALNDMKTPDGMDKLEWDEEVENAGDNNGEEDSLAVQYRWYADILDRTSSLLLHTPQRRDLNHQDMYGRCALHYAAAEGNTDCVRLLIAAGCHVDNGDWDSLMPLHLAAMSGHPEVARLLLCAGARVNAMTSNHTSALHLAASRGFVEMTQLLLDAGSNVDALDIADRSALMMAVSREQIDVVRLLIKHGAKVNTGEIHGYMPLNEAVLQKSTAMVELLLEAGAKVAQTCHLLHYAILHRHYEMTELLIKAGSLINFRDNSGSPPLACAAKSGEVRIAELLLAHGAIVNCSNSITGSTPLHEAVEGIPLWECSKFESMFHALHSHGALLNMPAVKDFDTPLHRAIVLKKYRFAMLLIQHGSDVTLKPDVNSYNILNGAMYRGGLDLARMIVYAGFDLQNSTSYSSQDPNSVTNWLVYMKKNPLRLSDLCRINIRRQLGDQVYKKIDLCYLPPSLKKFIRLEDIEA